MNTKRVEQLLTQQEWEQADSETEKLICSFCNYDGQEYLKPEDIDLIPLDILAGLENLWTTHSQRRFGFSVQEKIHNKVRNQIKYSQRDSLKRLFFDLLQGNNDAMSGKEALMVPYFYSVEVGWTEGHPTDAFGAYGRNKSYEELTFNLTAPTGHLPCGVWWTLKAQAKQVPIDVLLKKYGLLGISGSLVKYVSSIELYFFRRVRVACQFSPKT